MRMIDADRLKAHYSWWGKDDPNKQAFDDIVDEQPTVADVVTVTRCKDCRFYGAKYHRCGIFGCDKLEEGFCDEAVRREA